MKFVRVRFGRIIPVWRITSMKWVEDDYDMDDGEVYTLTPEQRHTEIRVEGEKYELESPLTPEELLASAFEVEGL